MILACHPEAGEARRGTSQALHRLREMFDAKRRVTRDLFCVTDSTTVRSLGRRGDLGMTCIFPRQKRPRCAIR